MPPHTFSLGQRIRELRSKKSLTQTALSKGLCTPSMISQIEADRARPSYKILMMIADRLDITLEQLLEDVDLNLEMVSRYKMARAMVAAKEYVTAIPLLLELLRERTSFPKAELQLGLIQCYLHTNQLDEAEAWIKEVHETAVVRGDSHLLVVAFQHLALLHFQRKKYQISMYHGLRALEQLDKLPLEEQDLFLKADILTMLGHVHTRTGMIREALPYLQEAAALHHETANLHELAQTYLELGQAHQQLNTLDKSVEYSERAYAIFRSEADWVNQARLEMHIAVFSASASIAGHEDIIPRLHAVIERFHSLGKQEEAGVAYVELAKFQLQFGDVAEAEKAYRAADRLLPDHHGYRAELERIRGQIAHRKGEREHAVQWLQIAADSFMRAGELGQWDDALHEVAEVYAEEEDHRRAYEVLVHLRAHRLMALQERGIVL